MLDQLRQTFTDNWIAWVYQYSLGSLFFFITLRLGIRAGTIDPQSRSGRRLIRMLVGGMALWIGFHFLWISSVQGLPGAMNQADVVSQTRQPPAPTPSPAGEE